MSFLQIDLFCFYGFECAAGAAERARTYYTIGRQIQIVALFLFHNEKFVKWQPVEQWQGFTSICWSFVSRYNSDKAITAFQVERISIKI